MKKTLWLGLLVVAVLAMTITPALAGGDKNRHHWRGDRFALVGEVTAMNDDDQTITVQVWMGSWLVKEYIDEVLTVTTTEETRFRRFDDPPHVFITFEDIEVGAHISATGNVVADDEGDDLFLAQQVTVDVPLQALAE